MSKRHLGTDAEALSVYDPIAWLYDPWSASVIEDVSFYVDEALAAGGEVVELAVGTGRIAIPMALAGAHVIGVDSSPGMLEVCAQRAREAGIAERLDLRLGDLRRPPVDERVPLVTCPFRSYLHLRDDDERLEALRAARELLRPAASCSTSSRRPAKTSRRRTGAGSSASRVSTSGPTGISRRRPSRSRCAAR